MPKMGVVLFGASTYDYHENMNRQSFANSVEEFRKTLSDPKITQGRETEVLDLYDKPLLPHDIITTVTDFVGKDYEDFIVYYCGHGDVGLREGDYRVFLRRSNRHQRHGTMLHIAGLIRDVQVTMDRKRVYFVINSCYSGSAISEMESMDAGGAETLIDRSLSEAIEGASGIAILAASGRLSVATAKLEDELTLFTGAFVRCLRDGIPHKSAQATLSWLDIKDEIIRTTRKRIGPDAPVPKLTDFGDELVDITRMPFFNNPAYVPRKNSRDGVEVDKTTREILFWKHISGDSSATVIEDFLTKFPAGMYASAARGLLARRIAGFGEMEIRRYLRDHPASKVRKELDSRMAEVRWQALQLSTDSSLLEQFVEKFPESDFAEEARSRLERVRWERAEAEAWEDVKSTEAPAELQQFLQTYPDGPRSRLAAARLEALNWELVQASSDSAEIERFIAEFPESKFADRARERIVLVRRKREESEAWERVKSTEAPEELEEFLQAYPDGPFSNLAAATLAALKWRSLHESVDIAELERFIIDFADSEFVGMARERIDLVRREREETEAWERVESAQMPSTVEKFLQAYPDGPYSKLAAARLAALKWQAVQASSDVAELEQFIAVFPECEFVDRAKERIALLKRRREEEETWARIQSSVEGLRRYLATNPDGPLGALASARLAKMTRRSWFAELSDRLRTGGTRYVAALVLALLGASVLYVWNLPPEEFAAELSAAGNDSGKLRAFVERCHRASCPLEQEGRKRLVEAEGRELDAAGTDFDKLRSFVERCRATSCAVLQEANRRFAAAQTEADRLRREKDLKDLDDAGTDAGKLRSFVDRCRTTSCALLQVANHRLTAAQAEADRLARLAAERKELDAANDIVKLRSFLARCRVSSCALEQEASNRLQAAEKALRLAETDKAKAEEAERQRLARIAADRAALDVAKNGGLGALRSFVQQCNANSCPVAQEARELLAKAEESDRNKPLGFTQFPNYGIDKSDLTPMSITSLASCSAKCQANNDCVAYVFDKWNSACYLKNQAGPLLQGPRSDTFVRTDQRPLKSTLALRTCPYAGSSMRGTVMKSSPVSSTSICRRECENDQGCLAYMFGRGLCTFFSSVSDRTSGAGEWDSGERTQDASRC